MNAERLIQLYDRIAEAPDAVSRLRRFVLDLAVRGKLVEEDPEDEPASELLKRIVTDRARREEVGEFQEPRNRIQIKRNDLPFTPPGHWEWARLIDIARPRYGFAFPSNQFNNVKRGMPLIRIRDISKPDTEAYFDGPYDPAYVVRAGDYLVGMDGDFNLRRWQGKDALLNQRVMRISDWRCGVDPEFIRLPLQFVLDHLHGATSLTTVKHLSAKQVNGIEVPLPPIAEQHRIVAKVDELMTLCNHLEETHNTRETTRDRLTTATLTRLSAPDTDNQSFRTHAHFALDTIPTLTAHPDQIKNLRQTILNLAVRGKLVEQDPTDKPPMALDAGIAGEVDIPFSIPEKWRWCRLKALGELKGGGTPSKTRDDYWGGEIPWVSPKDMKVDYIQRTQLQITETAVTESAANLIEVGSLLFVVRGMILAHSFPVAITEVPVATNQDMKALVFRRPEMANYVLRALKGLKPEMLAHVKRSSHGTCRIEADDYRDFLIPIPPQAEQGRIAAKVDELMVLCDQLETSLTKADMMRSHLLNSLLQEALKPAAEDLEAA